MVTKIPKVAAEYSPIIARLTEIMMEETRPESLANILYDVMIEYAHQNIEPGMSKQRCIEVSDNIHNLSILIKAFRKQG